MVLLLPFSSFRANCTSGAVGSLYCCSQQRSSRAADEDLCRQAWPGSFRGGGDLNRKVDEMVFNTIL